MDAALDPLAFDDAPNVAETGRSFAIGTNPAFCTGGFDVHAHRVYWS
jgi:hypothetical protein